jgi:hypothetical protein
MQITDPAHGFTGKFFSPMLASTGPRKHLGFSFKSDPTTTKNVRSVLGRERNGVFFSDANTGP